MKLISWNVNGLRACLNKGFLDAFHALDADLFCLQETKLQPGQVELTLEGYHQFWCSADKKGYSGTAVFSRAEPLSVRYGMGIDAHDHEGRLITLEFPGYFLVCCYTPNAQQELKRIDYRMQWEDDLLAYLQQLDGQKPVIYCGDLNVAHQEIDLKNPKTNRGNAGFSDEERACMTRLLSSGFTDTFRLLYPDVTGAYSWWSYRFHAREKNAGWRIDYCIVSDRLAPLVTGAAIHPEITGSDHCPVELTVDLS
jgi:exodeoxyribonuclease-3